MFWSIINIFLVVWAYMYLVNLKEIGCACASSPSLHFVIAYICLSLVLFAIGTFATLVQQERYAVAFGMFALVYLAMTIGFVYHTYKLVKELEAKRCDCASGAGPKVLEVLAVLRLVGLFMVLVSMVAFMNGVVVVNKSGMPKTKK